MFLDNCPRGAMVRIDLTGVNSLDHSFLLKWHNAIGHIADNDPPAKVARVRIYSGGKEEAYFHYFYLRCVSGIERMAGLCSK